MTDIYHAPELTPPVDDARAGSDRTVNTIAVLAFVLALAAPHLTGNNANIAVDVQDSKISTGQLDGRGKWIGYM